MLDGPRRVGSDMQAGPQPKAPRSEPQETVVKVSQLAGGGDKVVLSAMVSTAKIIEAAGQLAQSHPKLSVQQAARQIESASRLVQKAFPSPRQGLAAQKTELLANTLLPELYTRQVEGEPVSAVLPTDVELGQGAFKTMLLGVEVITDSAGTEQPNVRLVAYSRFRDSTSASEREAELSMARQLRGLDLEHPNIATVHVFSALDGQESLVAELAEGDFEAALASGKLETEQKLDVLIGCFEGTLYLEQRGVFHGDEKPGNVLLVGGQPKQSDFGESRVLGKKESCHAGLQDQGYVAPEKREALKLQHQLRGQQGLIARLQARSPAQPGTELPSDTSAQSSESPYIAADEGGGAYDYDAGGDDYDAVDAPADDDSSWLDISEDSLDLAVELAKQMIVIGSDESGTALLDAARLLAAVDLDACSADQELELREAAGLVKSMDSELRAVEAQYSQFEKFHQLRDAQDLTRQLRAVGESEWAEKLDGALDVLCRLQGEVNADSVADALDTVYAVFDRFVGSDQAIDELVTKLQMLQQLSAGEAIQIKNAYGTSKVDVQRLISVGGPLAAKLRLLGNPTGSALHDALAKAVDASTRSRSEFRRCAETAAELLEAAQSEIDGLSAPLEQKLQDIGLLIEVYAKIEPAKAESLRQDLQAHQSGLDLEPSWEASRRLLDALRESIADSAACEALLDRLDALEPRFDAQQLAAMSAYSLGVMAGVALGTGVPKQNLASVLSVAKKAGGIPKDQHPSAEQLLQKASGEKADWLSTNQRLVLEAGLLGSRSDADPRHVDLVSRLCDPDPSARMSVQEGLAALQRLRMELPASSELAVDADRPPSIPDGIEVYDSPD